MKKLALFFATALAALGTYAQTDTTDTIGRTTSETDLGTIKVITETETSKDGNVSDTTRIQFGKKMVTIITKTDDENMEVKVDSKRSGQGNKNSLTWWNGIDFGLNSMTGPDFQFSFDDEFNFLNPRLIASRYISGNFLALKGRLIGDYVGIVTGGTIQIYNWNFTGDFNFGLGDSLYAVPTGEVNVTKNKLRAEYVGIPLLLEFNTSLNPQRSFHITAGVIGKVRLGNMYGQHFSQGGDFNRTSIKGELGLNRWAADAVVRMGYGGFTLFAQYSLVPLFSADNAPDVRTFAAGLAFVINDR